MGVDIYTKVGQRIREVREGLGFTQAKLADLSNVSPEFLSRVERGLKAPSLITLSRIAEALGLQLKDLVDFGAEAPSRKKALAQRAARRIEEAPAAMALRIAAVVDVLVGSPPGKKK